MTVGINKLLILIPVLGIANLNGVAQTRYLDDTYFTNVQVDTTIQFGSNVTDTGIIQDLFLDFYQPVGDTVSARPLIIWIHGGGFTSGSRTDSHIQLWCNEFARRGYVTSSIDYRLGISGGSTGKLKAIYRSVQDAKAAIRFFRMNAALYQIDVNKIILAGSSVGGFTAVHTAYWDTDEIPAAIDTVALGNLEGSSGNPGYPSDPNAVVNFWGAIKDSTWIDAGEPMIVSCAGIEDSVVYPNSHSWPSGDEHGSIVIDRVAKSKNIPDTLHMFPGAKHTLSGGTGADQLARWDTATTVAAEFLYCNLISSCNVTAAIELNPDKSREFSVYPNPGNSNIIIESGKELIGNGFKITDVSGNVLLSGMITSEKTTIAIEDFVQGIYFFQLADKSKGVIKLIKQ